MENDIEKIFDEFKEEFLLFELVEKKLSNRPDLHAFMLLDSLFPDTRDMIAAANHDEIYLEVSPEALIEKATKEQIRELVRCGVIYSSCDESLTMFV
jgi:hypothetical protein